MILTHLAEMGKEIVIVLGTVTTISGALILFKNKLFAWITKDAAKGLEEARESRELIHKKLERMDKDLQKQIIYNPNADLIERIHAGDKYIELGGNGAVKIYLEVLKKQYENEIKGNK